MGAIKSLETTRRRLGEGLAIPACPLALDANRKFDEQHQRGLIRYYLEAGAGGIAVGVHTTQFAIRDPEVGLYRPVLQLVAETTARNSTSGIIRVAGLCGGTRQAAAEAEIARSLGYDAGLLSLSALRHSPEDELIAHCRSVSEVLPLFGFYLQPAVGGRSLPYSFWRRFAEIENLVAIKVAPFNRYQTLDVIRALAEAGRPDVALYTGNDDNIVLDLLTPFRIQTGKISTECRFVGGLLGHWAVWTRKAVELHARCRSIAASQSAVPPELLRLSAEVTDMNAAIFDAANGFRGCIPGVHEVLRRQGLLAGTWCLDPHEQLSPGQAEEIDRVCRAYPHLLDDAFVAENLDRWASS